MRLTTYKNREFHTGIYRQGNKPSVEKCENGHWKQLGKECEACKADSSVQQANS